MSIASISSSLVNLYSAQGAAASTPARNKPPADADHGAHRNEHATGRRSVLVDAMLTALKELGLGGLPSADAPATPPTASASPATPAAADTATSATSSTDAAAATATTSPAPTPSTAAAAASADDSASFGDVTQAVAHFAHALWSAVRDTDAAKAGDVGVDNDNHTGTGRRHHHRHVHGAEHGYDNLAERLAALASVTDPAAASLKTATEVAQHAVATATAAQPEATAGTTDPTAATTATATTATDATTATSGATTANAGPDAGSVVVAADPTVAAAAPTPAPSPLADAFGQLLNALSGGSALSGSESTALLSRFLHTLASALQPSQVANAAPVATGALIDVTA